MDCGIPLSLYTCRAIGEPALSLLVTFHFGMFGVLLNAGYPRGLPSLRQLDQDSDPTFCTCRQKRALFGEGDSEGKNVTERAPKSDESIDYHGSISDHGEAYVGLRYGKMVPARGAPL
jgi:hypothetical protein